MGESSEKNEYIFDTSALISLGAIRIIDDVLKLAKIVITPSIIKELEEFAKYEDEYGKASKEVLKCKNKFIVKSTEIKESIEYIQTTDNELYNIAKRLSSTLITDDIKFSRHVDGKIDTQFSTFFLTLLVSSRHLSKTTHHRWVA
ncbi:MAG: type II toxin-antitoxin system VapC family toxin [Nanoarchaeota archaeon]